MKAFSLVCRRVVPLASSLKHVPRNIFPLSSLPMRNFTTKDVSAVKGDLKTVTRAVVSAISDEKESLQDLDQKQLQEFCKASGYEIEEKDGVVYLRKNVDNYSVTLTFNLPDDDFNLDEQGNEDDAQEEEKEGEEEEGEGDDQEVEKTIDMELIIESQKGGQITKLYSDLAIGKDRNVYIENIRFGEKGSGRLWTSDLNPPLQEKLYEYLEYFGIDSDLTTFVLEYRAGARSRDALQVLTKFLDFLGEQPTKK